MSDNINYIPKCQCESCDLREMFFDFVGMEEMDNICLSRKEVKHPRGSVIIQAGEQIKEFIYLKEGLVKLYRSDELEKSQIIAIGKPMDFVQYYKEYNEAVGQEDQARAREIEEQVVRSIMKEIARLSNQEYPF